ncbi:MAG: MOSC domain-containing protein [Planctomycetota bacterium]
MIKLFGLQTGQIVTEGDPDTRDITRRQWTSAFNKSAVLDPVSVGPLGIEGDQVADTVHHGGVDKAVLCYANEHYAEWSADYPELPFGPGGFGENLTWSGADETDVCLGDKYLIGNVVFEVCQPRQPCWKISRRWGEKTLTKRVTQTGRTGWYVRVLTPGTIQVGSEIELIARPHPEWTIRRTTDLMFGITSDRAATIELMAIDELSQEWKKDIA